MFAVHAEWCVLVEGVIRGFVAPFSMILVPSEDVRIYWMPNLRCTGRRRSSCFNNVMDLFACKITPPSSKKQQTGHSGSAPGDIKPSLLLVGVCISAVVHSPENLTVVKLSVFSYTSMTHGWSGLPRTGMFAPQSKIQSTVLSSVC